MTANHNPPKLILPVDIVSSGPDVEPMEDVSAVFCHALEVTPRPSANMHALHHSAIQLADFLFRYSSDTFLMALLVQLQYLMDAGWIDSPLDAPAEDDAQAELGAEPTPAGKVSVKELPPFCNLLLIVSGFTDHCPEAVCKAMEHTLNQFPYWIVHYSDKRQLQMMLNHEYKDVIKTLDGTDYWEKVGVNRYRPVNNAYANWSLSAWQRGTDTLLHLETPVPDVGKNYEIPEIKREPGIPSANPWADGTRPEGSGLSRGTRGQD